MSRQEIRIDEVAAEIRRRVDAGQYIHEILDWMGETLGPENIGDETPAILLEYIEHVRRGGEDAP